MKKHAMLFSLLTTLTVSAQEVVATQGDTYECSREPVKFEKWVLYHAKSLRVRGFFLCSIFGSGLLVITAGS